MQARWIQSNGWLIYVMRDKKTVCVNPTQGTCLGFVAIFGSSYGSDCRLNIVTHYDTPIRTRVSGYADAQFFKKY